MSASEIESAFTAIVKENAGLKESMEELRRENTPLSDQLSVLLNRIFRKKSERFDPNQ